MLGVWLGIIGCCCHRRDFSIKLVKSIEIINWRLIQRFLAGIIFNNETAVESRNFMENEKIAGFGHFSSVSPPPSVESSSPFSPPTTDMSEVYLPRTVQGEIVIDNMQFTPDLANKSSGEFQRFARSIETEVIYR